jgi:hypothetical protein
MPVNVTIPIPADYREITTVGFDHISGLILVGTSLYACGGLATGKFLKVDNGLTTSTILTFPSDGKHEVPIDICHAPSTNTVYVLFANAGNGQVTIGTVNVAVSPPVIGADFLNIDLTGDFTGPISLATDNEFLYFISEVDSPSHIEKYRLSNGTYVADGPITGFTGATGIRHSGGKLFIKGVQAPSTAWVVRMTTALAVEQSTTFDADAGAGLTHDFGVSGSHIWLGSKDTLGIVRRFLQSDLTRVSNLSTGQSSKCTEAESDGTNIWAFFENGRGVRINPSTSEQRIYTLNDGQGFQSEMTGDGTYQYTAWNQVSTKIARYHIPSDVATTWAIGAGGAFGDSGKAIAIDRNGDIVATGYFKRDIIFKNQDGTGGITLSAPVANSADMFLVKYSAGGQLLWAFSFGGAGDPEPLGITVDKFNQIWVCGTFTGTCNFGGANLTPVGNYDAFLAKYSSDGAHLFSNRFGGTSNTAFTGVASDSVGNIVACGKNVIGISNYGGANLYANQGKPPCVAKYDNSGNHLWSMVGVTAGLATATGIAIDQATDNIFVAGGFQGNLTMDPAEIDATGHVIGTTHQLVNATLTDVTDDMFIVKFNSDGTYNRGQRYGLDKNEAASAITLDSNANPIVCGGFSGRPAQADGYTDLGTGFIDGTALYSDGFIAKYSGTTGAVTWVVPIKGTYQISLASVKVDAADNVYLVGFFKGTFNFNGQVGGPTLSSTGGTTYNDICYAKYDSSGNMVGAAAQYGASADDLGNSIAVTPLGASFITAIFSGTITIAGKTLTSSGGQDILIARVS